MQLSFDQITIDPVYLFEERNIKLSILRLDKIHPVISGNKWFKLKYYLQEAKNSGKKMIVTFGGAWSNHIVAAAAACGEYDLSSAGIIRGEEPSLLSPTLMQAKDYGMQLHFISREEYKDNSIPAALGREDYYLINEGGYGPLGAQGAEEITDYVKDDFTHYCCAVGTGTMMAGLINRTRPTQQVIGISVLRNNFQLEQEVAALVHNKYHLWKIIHEYHFGGYAKHSAALIEFMNDFYKQTSIPTDFVYTGKLFFAVSELIKDNFFPAGSKLLVVHSGGLQGNRSLEKGTLIY